MPPGLLGQRGRGATFAVSALLFFFSEACLRAERWLRIVFTMSAQESKTLNPKPLTPKPLNP